MTGARCERAVVIAVLVLGVWGCDDEAPSLIVDTDAESTDVLEERQDALDEEIGPSSADVSASDSVADVPAPPKPDVSQVDGGPTDSQTGGPVVDEVDQDVPPEQDVDMADATPEDADVGDATLEDIAGAEATLEDVAGADVTLEDVAGADVMLEDVAGADVMLEDVAGADATLEDVAGQDVLPAQDTDVTDSTSPDTASDVSMAADGKPAPTGDVSLAADSDGHDAGPVEDAHLQDASLTDDAKGDIIEEDSAEEDTSGDGSNQDIINPVPEPKGDPGWRLTFIDDFEGPESPDDPCYDQEITPARCMDRYWSQNDCPADVSAQLSDLNKCVWSVYDIYNWMDWDKPFGYGINKLDRRSVRVEGGELILDAALNPSHDSEGSCGEALDDGYVTQDCPIHSGAVTSKAFGGGATGFSQAYGRWEVRARLAMGPGAWPAHWLLPQNGGWPDAGEIDIMEAIADYPTSTHGSFHGGTIEGETKTHHSVHNWHDPEDDRFSEVYHVYAIEWGAGAIRFFVDDLQIGVVHEGTMLETKVEDSPDEALIDTYWGMRAVDIPDTPFHWILNTSIVPNGGLTEKAMADFEAMSHHIDWVRVYEACTTDEEGCLPKSNRSVRVTEERALSFETWSAEKRVHHIGDFDGDGVDDVLLRARAEDDGSFWVPGASGIETFSPAVEVTDSALMWSALWCDAYRDAVVGDFDGDGADDLMLPTRGQYHESYLLLGGAEPFDDYTVVTDSWGLTNSLWSTEGRQTFAADVSGDGADDLILLAHDGEDLSFLLVADGQGGFYDAVSLEDVSTLNTSDWALDGHRPAFGDFNGDGVMDIFLQANTTSGSTYMALGDGVDGFDVLDITEHTTMNAEKWSVEWREPHVADLNGDGVSDLILQTRFEGHATYILLADGFGDFAPELVATDLFGMDTDAWSFVYRQGVVADFDGDGCHDLALIGKETGAQSLLLRADGDGGFETKRIVTDHHVMSSALWSTSRHALGVGSFEEFGTHQLLVQGGDVEEDSYVIDLRDAL